MSWIRVAVAGLALCASATLASAQGAPGGVPGEGRGPGMRGGERGQAMLFVGITLTPAQQERIEAIRAKYRAERGKLMPGRGGARPDSAARAKMTAMTTRQNAEIRAVLTAEQQRVFDNNVSEQKRRRDQMRANRS